MQAQFRPISPRPPRKTTRTGEPVPAHFALGAAGLAGRADLLAPTADDDPGDLVTPVALEAPADFGFRRRPPEGEPPVDDADTLSPVSWWMSSPSGNGLTGLRTLVDPGDDRPGLVVE